MKQLIRIIFCHAVLIVILTLFAHPLFAQSPPETETQILSYTFKYNLPDLGQIHIMGPPGNSYLSVKNSGTDSVTITDINFIGDQEFTLSSNYSLPHTLQPNQVAMSMFGFTFVQQDPGIRTAKLIIFSNSSSSPDTLSITAETVDPGFGPWDWEIMGCPFGDCNLGNIYVDPEDDNIWYVGSTNDLYITRDGGDSWQKTLSGNLGRPRVKAIDPRYPYRVYATMRDNLYVTSDKGLTWTLLRTGIGVTSMTVNENNGTLYIASGVGIDGNVKNPGVYISSDYGTTWSFHSFGIEVQWVHPWDIEHDPVNGILYVCAEIDNSPSPYDPPFFRSLDNGVTWEDVDVSDALYWHGTKIQINPDNQDVYCLLEGSNVFKSSDYGLTWKNQSYPGWFDLLLDNAHENCLFGSGVTYGGYNRGGVYVSLDEGRHYELIGLSNLSVGGISLNSTSSKIYTFSPGVGIFTANVPTIIDLIPRGGISVRLSVDKTYSERLIAHSSEDGIAFIVPENTNKDQVSIREAAIDSIRVYADSSVYRSATFFDNGNYWSYIVDTTGNISEKSEFTIFGNEYDKDAPMFGGLIVNEPPGFLRYSCSEDNMTYVVPLYSSSDPAMIRHSALDSLISRVGVLNYMPISKLDEGTYWLMGIDFNGNVSSARLFVIIATGIEASYADEISVYPNPTSDFVYVQTKAEGTYSIEIITATGQLIFDKKMEGPLHQIDLALFLSGYYFITIRSDNIVITRKIIVL